MVVLAKVQQDAVVMERGLVEDGWVSQVCTETIVVDVRAEANVFGRRVYYVRVQLVRLFHKQRFHVTLSVKSCM